MFINVIIIFRRFRSIFFYFSDKIKNYFYSKFIGAKKFKLFANRYDLIFKVKKNFIKFSIDIYYYISRLQYNALLSKAVKAIARHVLFMI